jgi:hypothetical protein
MQDKADFLDLLASGVGIALALIANRKPTLLEHPD